MADYANTKDAIRLCEVIIRDAFGEVVCRVASTLLNRGRLNTANLIRLSGLKPKNALNALIILIQHNIVLSNGASIWETEDEDLYQFDLEACLLRMRWGKMLAITQERFGDVAVEAIRQIMVFGKLKVPDIIRAAGGEADVHYGTQVETVLIDLLKARFLEVHAAEQQISLGDRIERRFRTLKRDASTAGNGEGEGGTKHLFSVIELENFRNKATDEIVKIDRDLRDPVRAIIKKPKLDKKRKSKKDDGFDYSLHQNLHLRLNYDRFGVIIRDELLAKSATDRWNAAAGEITRTLLDIALVDESRMDDEQSVVVGLNQITERYPKDKLSGLQTGIVGAPSKQTVDLIKEYLGVMSGDDRTDRMANAFLGNDGSYFNMEFAAVAVKLRASLMMELVRSHLGGKEARVLATVAKAQRITEQTVRNVAMMPLKDARKHLAKLHKMGLIETSEISKNPLLKRQIMTAASEHNMWALDLPRAYTVLLTAAYKTLGNILQRRATEKEKRKAAYDKLEQASSRGYGREVLSAKDQEDLVEGDDIDNKLTLALSRCEMVVFIMRDMPGWPTKKKTATSKD